MIEVDYTGPKVKVPEPATIFGAIENELRAGASEIRDRIVHTARRNISKRTGKTAAETVGSVRQTAQGYRVNLENKRSAHILNFLTEGTGIYGPRGKKIPFGLRGSLPGGRRPSGKGMRPQGTIGKILRSINAEVMPAAMDQMQDAWTKATAKFARGGR